MQRNNPKKTTKILHVCSILQEAPTLLPVPPIAGGAPCWNVYRLHEALRELDTPDLEAEVVSACDPYQILELQAFPQQAQYHWIVLPSWERRLGNVLRRASPYSMAVMRSTLGAPTWLSYRYLRQVRRYWQTQQFDLMIVDDAPQNLQYVSRFVPREKLAFFFRGQIGMSRRYLDRCGLLITTNDNLVSYVEKVLPPSRFKPRIAVVPNSLGPEFANVVPKERVLSGSKRTIIYAGRFVEVKGVRELVKAFQIVHSHFPDARLRIVGSSSYDPNHVVRLSDYETEVRNIAADLPEGAVTFSGFVPYERMPEEYLAADIAVFPSLWVEGFGMVALEAMRCGLPVIVSSRPGFTSFIRHGTNGLVVDRPEDITELAGAIMALLADVSLANSLAQAGRATVERYTSQVAAQSFLELCSSFLSENSLK